MMGYYYGAGNMFGAGGIFMLVFWIVLIFLAVWMIREFSVRHHHHEGHASNRALEILKERYAKGEISKDEFESKKKDIA